MTETCPSLTAGPKPTEDDPTRATAVLRFPRRELSWVGAVPDGRRTGDVNALREADLDGQPSFAGAPFVNALESSRPLARQILEQIAGAFRRSLGESFTVHRLFATVRIDNRADYTQLQDAHIDWARLTEFHEEEWSEAGVEHPRRGRGTLRSLARCHSIDCVIGGPPTEYFLIEQDATVLLSKRHEAGPWIVTGLRFPARGAPRPGLTAALVYRPPFTVHQFPRPDSWRGKGPLRLFVSCDYWTG
jgi:hypothetical protein